MPAAEGPDGFTTLSVQESIMRLVELVARHVRIPLKKTIRHASHSRTETDSLVVELRSEDGISGWGEGLPRAYVTEIGRAHV